MPHGDSCLFWSFLFRAKITYSNFLLFTWPSSSSFFLGQLESVNVVYLYDHYRLADPSSAAAVDDESVGASIVNTE